MKLIRHILLPTLVVLACAVTAEAQQTQSSSSSSSVVRRGPRDSKAAATAPADRVTDRMSQRFASQGVDDSEQQWMKVVYRQIDLDKVDNAPLYYPEEIVDGQENLFRIIMRLLADGTIPAYEYLDGREVFTDEYRTQVRDMLDRFHVLYTEAKGSTEKNPRFSIEESDVPCNEVLSYYLLEKWELDKRTNRMRTVVEAICPVLHRTGDFGGEAVKYPMFWIRMADLRPYLVKQPVFIGDDNNLAQYTYDDFFTLGLYQGDIYKTRNLRNRSMMQLYPDPDDMRRAQDSIQNHLANFEKKMWVPTREEIIAAREAREAGDTIASRDNSAAASTLRSSNARAKRASKPKTPKVKQSSVKGSSAGAVRSVRRTKNN